MKRFATFSVFLMSGLAFAQSVDWNKAWDACPSEKAAFDRAAQGTGYSWRANRDYTAGELGQQVSRERLLRKLEEAKAKLRTDTDSYGQASWGLTICGLTAVLNQRHSGSTQSAAAPPPSNRNSGRNQPDKVASHCMDDVPARPGIIRNTCNQQVTVRWCSLNYGTHACGNGNLGSADVLPGGTAVVDRDVKIHLIACAAPTRPTDIEYTPSSGFLYNCTQ